MAAKDPSFVDLVKSAVEEKPPKKEKAKVDASAITGAAPKKEEPIPALALTGLGTIERGRKSQPPRILLYGIDGVGKSTWASEAPNAIFIPTEDGLNEIDCHKFPLSKSFREFCDRLQTIATEKHDYETIVVDSLDWLERLIWKSVCLRTNASNIEKVGGGYAKGYTYAIDEFRQVLDLLEECRARGMVVILIAHSKIEKFEDPESNSYDRYSPRLNKHAEALVREWVDATLFFTRRIVVTKEEAGFTDRGIAKPVGPGGGERLIRTVGGPACVAKNRYDLPDEMPAVKGQGWNTFLSYLMKGK